MSHAATLREDPISRPATRGRQRGGTAGHAAVIE